MKVYVVISSSLLLGNAYPPTPLARSSSSLYGGGSLSDECQYGAVVSSHLIEGAVLTLEGKVVIRARLGDNAYLAEGLQCLEGGRAHLTGIQWQIVEPSSIASSNNNSCSEALIFNPSGAKAIRGGTHDTPGYQCTPEIYHKNPWSCAAGDLSGKFGPLDLGLHDLLSELKRYRFLMSSLFRSSTESVVSDFDSRSNADYASSFSHARIREEQHVYTDHLPVPPCQLQGKYLAMFCADGRIAGCAPFKSLFDEPDDVSFDHPLEPLLYFLTHYPPPPACPVPKPCATWEQDKAIPPPNGAGTPNNGWTDKIGREIGKVPDYVSSWWEDVKRKGREAWKQL